MFNGANWQDLSSDFEKNYMSVPHLMVCDGEHAGSVKRTAPEGTPDREALARSKMPSTDIVPKVLDPQPEDEVSRVEMSPAIQVCHFHQPISACASGGVECGKGSAACFGRKR